MKEPSNVVAKSEVVAAPENILTSFVRGDLAAVHKEIDEPTIGLWMVLYVLLFVGLVASWRWDTLRGIEPYSAWGGGIRDTWQFLFHIFLSPIVSTGELDVSGIALMIGPLLGHIFFPPSFEWWFGIWAG